MKFGATSMQSKIVRAATMAMFALGAAAQSAFAANLVQVTGFGSNPGNLAMYKYVPASMPANAPLVVAMHGCSQSASSVDDEWGWVKYADLYKFYVVFPQQSSANNFSNCFNWMNSGDQTRGQGEALSIKQMVDRMKSDHSIDGNRVFVNGASAGGAMTSVMLATYPDVFAGGSVFSGGPYKCATSSFTQSFCLQPGVNKTPQQWGDLARSGYSGYTGRKPKVAIWHGTSDNTVNPMNLTELMEQWTNYHGIDQTADVSETVNGYPHKVYKDASGNALVETFSITGMGHAIAVDPGTAVNQCGSTGQYQSDMNICATYLTGKFWGLF